MLNSSPARSSREFLLTAHFPAARVGVADRGIREGILRCLAMQGRDIPVTRREYRK